MTKRTKIDAAPRRKVLLADPDAPSDEALEVVDLAELADVQARLAEVERVVAGLCRRLADLERGASR